MKLEKWDTVGQKRYRTIIEFFYNDTSVIILVSNFTIITSFITEIKSYWPKEIKKYFELLHYCFGQINLIIIDEKEAKHLLKKQCDIQKNLNSTARHILQSTSLDRKEQLINTNLQTAFDV